ncbi:MAG: hypothetical protein RL095_3076 [Verrucomicrobiota bacterium]|jgi:putative oxidoreductase
MLKKLLAPGKADLGTDLGLLLLRLWLGGSMVALHGWDKLSNFNQKASTFPDPLGIGSTASLAGCCAAEVLCAFFLVLGLGSRLVLPGLIFTMAVAWGKIHNFALSDNLLLNQRSGELAYIYLAGFCALLLTGPGRFSLDALICGKGGGASPKSKEK